MGYHVIAIRLWFFIRQQKLAKHTIEGAIEVDNEETYNKLSECFSDFKFKVSRNEPKSYYSKEELSILHECRTRPNTGIMHIAHKIAHAVEIDVSKAYSASFGKITTSPILSFFW